MVFDEFDYIPSLLYRVIGDRIPHNFCNLSWGFSIIFFIPLKCARMGDFPSPKPDLLYEFPLFFRFQVSIFQSPESVFSCLWVRGSPWGVCKVVKGSSPILRGVII